MKEMSELSLRISILPAVSSLVESQSLKLDAYSHNSCLLRGTIFLYVAEITLAPYTKSVRSILIMNVISFRNGLMIYSTHVSMIGSKLIFWQDLMCLYPEDDDDQDLRMMSHQHFLSTLTHGGFSNGLRHPLVKADSRHLDL